MKKLIFGSLLFAIGTLGVIAMVAAAITSPMNPSEYWEPSVLHVVGWFAVILNMRALAPFIIFCLMSAAGLALCAFETFRKNSNS